MTRRDGAVGIVAFALGLAIAWMDASPRFDDTGVTALSIFVAAAIIAAAAARRPWLYALLIGVPLPIVEIAQHGSFAPVAALVFAAAGAAVGWAAARAARRGDVR